MDTDARKEEHPMICRCGEAEDAHNNLNGCRTRDGAWCPSFRPAEEE